MNFPSALKKMIITLGDPNSEERSYRQLQLLAMHFNAIQRDRALPILVPILLLGCKEVGDEAWWKWFQSPSHGIVIHEWAMSSGLASGNLLEG